MASFPFVDSRMDVEAAKTKKGPASDPMISFYLFRLFDSD
jgi:hypothetical protein